MSDAPAPAARLSFEGNDETVRVVLGGETIAESAHTVVLHETGHAPMRYFPRGDVLMDRFRRTDHATHCPYKGDAAYWTIEAGGRVAENAAWSYEDPIPEAVALKDL
ncbi:MAG: DUF427 domain-containing protein, partial [Rhodospirillales bacterium]|nr:DUF427 domain-containing protein [Rhodospirillales bacterium]